MDRHTKQQRSYNMSQVKGKNTKLEIIFRQYIWNKGLRGYRLHAKLPGKPDLFFGPKKVAVFIDGCFWHKCALCFKGPKTNKKFWSAKIRSNVERDLDNDIKLKKLNIEPIRFWEHEIKEDIEKCYKKIKKFVDR
ncbi:very short patch repair endonuclease [Patescibacteria group bacterium]|nr:very short patch repair endonuclease [Patescibacteria group bacterium]MBU1683345.1 very short patch repair endonuclease [Patescibacteria group bacterium]MBU1934937.1 very short patch repair endonuclease [Patescibacteria group bacterium]